MGHTFEDITTFHELALNWDDDLMVLPPAHARNFENIIISDEYNHNIVTNVKGNELKNDAVGGGTFDYPSSISGSDRVIGFCENKEFKAGIFFIYNSDGWHNVVQYYSDTDTMEYLFDSTADTMGDPIFTGTHTGLNNQSNLTDSAANFGGVGTLVDYYVHNITKGESALITSNTTNLVVGTLSGGADWDNGDVYEIYVNVGALLNFPAEENIDCGIIGSGTSTYLVWTDGVNKPRIVNIDMAINGSYTSIRDTTISLYKRPYLGFITPTFLPDTSISTNNLRGFLWQFAIRLKYVDKTYSALSPFSDIPIPDDETFINGKVITVTENNRLQILIEDCGDDNIDEYQLCFRKIDIESGTPSEWYLTNIEWTASTPNQYTYFYGSEEYSVLSIDYSDKIQDWVPDLADHLAIIDSNRILLGDITEGYDNIDSGTFDVTISAYNPSLPSFTHYEVELIGTAGSPLVYTLQGDSYHRLFVMDQTTSPYIAVYSYYNPADKQELTDFFVAAVNADFGAGTISSTGSPNYNINSTIASPGGIYLSSTTANIHVPVFKELATHYFGIQYIYNGKYGFVQKDENCAYTVPMDASGISLVNSIQVTIGHDPPEGATHYQVVYLGSNFDYFEEYLIEIEINSSTDQRIVDNDYITVEGDYLNINRDNLINYSRLTYGDSINYGFDFQVGDIVYFKGYFGLTGGANIRGDSLTSFTTALQTPILYVSSTEIRIENIVEGEFVDAFGDAKYVVIQIIRKKEVLEGDTYQAIPGIYEISEGYHTANYQDQTSLLDAIVRLDDFGDCFFTKRIFANELISDKLYWYSDPVYINGINYWLFGNSEQINYSLFYPSQLAFFGKPSVYNEFAEQKKINKIRWGGPYLDESGVNFMTAFDYEDEKYVDEKSGAINRMQQIGDTLKVYQERKVNSFYLKTTSSTDAAGNQTYVFDNSVMSDARQSVTDYGCTHFESYVKTVRNAYFFDLINATVLRDTPGGLIPIGDIKMQTYFRKKAREIEESADYIKVIGGYDEYLKMYLITFINMDNSSDTLNETIGYFEGTERWVSFYDYIPEYYGKISGDTAIAFSGGKLYMQNKNSTRNNFFGSQYDSLAQIISKGHLAVIKTWDSIEIHSTGQWSPNQQADIEITIPELMQSRIPEGYFELHEGIYHADFLRDATDGGGAGNWSRNNLHNGRVLRGSVMSINLRNNDTAEANLRLVNIKSTISK